MTWKHTPSQGAGLGLLVSFIDTTLTISIHSPYHAGNYVKDFAFAPNLKNKNPVCVLFTWSSLAINTQSKKLITTEIKQFLPLPPQHKISVSRVEDATANTLVHH